MNTVRPMITACLVLSAIVIAIGILTCLQIDVGPTVVALFAGYSVGTLALLATHVLIFDHR
jgi:hypothetical protein